MALMSYIIVWSSGMMIGWVAIFNIFIHIIRKSWRADSKEDQIFRTYVGDALSAQWRDKHHVTNANLLWCKLPHLYTPLALDDVVALGGFGKAMPVGGDSRFDPRTGDGYVRVVRRVG